MNSTKDWIDSILMFLPIGVGWYLGFRLSAYRQDGRGFIGAFFENGFHSLRPDLYTDEGQSLLRWVWALTILTIPWWVLVIAIGNL